MPDTGEDASSSERSKASKKDVWEVVESTSRIIAALAIPVVLGVGGWVIQGTVSQQTVSKDYVSLATNILQKSDSAEGLRRWAVDLLNRTSPVPLDKTTEEHLVKGNVNLPSQTPLRRLGSFLDPVSPAVEVPAFIPAPATNRASLELQLHDILPGVDAKIAQAQAMVFHAVGDTGGVSGTRIQEALATVMEKQIEDTRATHNPAEEPLFFYHLGSVVFFNGLSTDYLAQFYQPYQHYDAPIFAIPGNHDGDTRTRRGDVPNSETTLFGFIQNFCAPSPQNIFKQRRTMTQPYVYWTLETPLATIIGLYSNVAGELDAPGTLEPQLRWFEQQLKVAPADRALIVAVHHPPYSLGTSGRGFGDIGDALDRAFKAAGRSPDLVLSSLVHNYQRFTRKLGNKQVPYIVAGAGGYTDKARSMHPIVRDPDTSDKIVAPVETTLPNVTLSAYNDTEPGFLRLKVTKTAINGEYYTIDFQGNPQGVRDTFIVPL